MSIIVEDQRTLMHRLKRFRTAALILLMFGIVLVIVYMAAVTAFRRRYDSLSIGMPIYKVIQLLGDPGLTRSSTGFTPNYSERLEVEDGAIVHTKYGVPWKHYWSRLQDSAFEETWLRDSQEIVVHYDHRRRVTVILWFEWRKPLPPWFADVCSKLGFGKELVYERTAHPI